MDLAPCTVNRSRLTNRFILNPFFVLNLIALMGPPLTKAGTCISWDEVALHLFMWITLARLNPFWQLLHFYCPSHSNLCIGSTHGRTTNARSKRSSSVRSPFGLAPLCQ